MTQLSVEDLKKIIAGLSDDYMLFMHYDNCITDRITEIEVDFACKQVIFK